MSQPEIKNYGTQLEGYNRCGTMVTLPRIYCDITICDELFKLMVLLFQNGIFSGNP